MIEEKGMIKKNGTNSRNRESNNIMKECTRVVSFTSGKGGIGKSNTVLNTAISLADMGRSVLILDADLGLANIDVLCGVTPKRSIKDVLEGKAGLKDIIVEGPLGISLIPASSGVEYLARLTHTQRLTILNEVEAVAARYDYLLIDTAAGIGTDVMFFNAAASEIVCVINGEPTSLTDSYAVIKVLTQNYGEKKISILANNVQNEAEGVRAFNRLSQVTTRFLPTKITYSGTIPSDISVTEAVKQQTPVLTLFPSSSVARSFRAFARKLDEEFYEHRIKGGVQFFFQQLLEGEGLNG
jgi:flagellar biosynthesis protein FlhG